MPCPYASALVRAATVAHISLTFAVTIDAAFQGVAIGNNVGIGSVAVASAAPRRHRIARRRLA